MNTYLLFKSLHLIAVISWMAGLLYLPRIFVYHAENNSETKISEVFKIMEKKLFFYIMTPRHDLVVVIWSFINSQPRFSTTRAKMDAVKDNICVNFNFLSFLSWQYS